jgi:hypothetical protein
MWIMGMLFVGYFRILLLQKHQRGSLVSLQGQITSWQQFETAFMTQSGDGKTSGILFLELSRIKIDKKENIKDFNQ